MDQEKMAELINKAEITSVGNRYFRAIDEKDFDVRHFAALFTTGAQSIRSDGSSTAEPEKISASLRQSFTRFEGSQHLVSGHDVSIDNGTATVRANLVAMHMWLGSKTNANNPDNFFIAGGVIDATLVQADDQWRISKISNAVVWRAGGFKDILQTDRLTD